MSASKVEVTNLGNMEDLDVVVVDAGFACLHLLDRLRCLGMAVQVFYSRVEATVAAEAAWRAQVLEMAAASLFPPADPWYLGANIPGKQREFLSFSGGLPTHMARCRESAERGYEGFAIS